MNIVEVREGEQAVYSVGVPAGAEVPAVIKVVGAGGAGSNAVNNMIEHGLSGVEFIAMNTDLQHLKNFSIAQTKLQIGAKVTGGRGAGGVPEKGEKAANEDRETIAAHLRNADMVFVTAGMGGGTGTGAAPVIAQIAKEQGALTIGVVTKPFNYEGRYKMKLAEEGIERLREAVDTLIVIPNQNLFKKIDRDVDFDNCCLMADDVLRQAVQGISDIITKTGKVNTDFADVEAIMKGQGDALMGIGIGSGENRAVEAATAAINNPMLEDTSINGATKLLVNIASSRKVGLVEINEAVDCIKAKADPDVNIIHGVFYEDNLQDKIRVTVIATGFSGEAKAAVLEQETGRKQDSDIIDYSEFERMREQSLQKQRPDYLSQRNYSDDLDIPTVIREHNFDIGNTEKKIVGRFG